MLTRKRFTKSYSRKKTKKIIQVGSAATEPIIKEIETAIKKRITYFGDIKTVTTLGIGLPNLRSIDKIERNLNSMPSLFTTLRNRWCCRITFSCSSPIRIKQSYGY